MFRSRARLSAQRGPQALIWRSAWRRPRGLPEKKQEKAMLQKLDTEHLNRLALADALASMEPRDLDPIAASVARRCACLASACLILVAGSDS